MTHTLTLDDLCEPWPAAVAPYLDQPNAEVHGILDAKWNVEGYVILRGFLPDDLIDAYADAWLTDNGCARCGTAQTCATCKAAPLRRLMGWPYNTPYMHVPAVRNLCCYGPLQSVLQSLIGEPCAVHLNLTGWRSTQRNWHQDGYLNPDSNADHYAAVWFALDDIDPHAGPFQYVPGSHRKFGIIRQDRMLNALRPDERGADWPTHSERILTPLFEDRLRHDRVIPNEFIASRGDVLIWHSRLLHRGSVPIDATLERRACIAHYSGVHHRPDMPARPQRHGDGYYFPIDEGGHR